MARAVAGVLYPVPFGPSEPGLVTGTVLGAAIAMEVSGQRGAKQRQDRKSNKQKAIEKSHYSE